MHNFRGARRRGQGLSEYGLVLGLVAVVAITALSSTGGAVSGLIGQIAGAVSAGSNPCDVQGCTQGCIDAFNAAGGYDADPSVLRAGRACVGTCFRSYSGANCNAQQGQ